MEKIILTAHRLEGVDTGLQPNALKPLPTEPCSLKVAVTGGAHQRHALRQGGCSVNKTDETKAKLEHMENRTQWHEKDVKEVEALRNEVTKAESGGKISDKQKEQNKVKHKH